MSGTEPGSAGGEGARREARPRPRRADVQQLFDTLGQAEPEKVKSVTNSLAERFILVPAGSFQMGSKPDEDGHRINEGPLHEVVITQPYYLGVHPVTQATYNAVVGKNPARFDMHNGGGPNHPVENVSWDDAVAFCRLLSDRPEERAARRSYRLPTEAEWEFACRCGTTTPFGHGPTFIADHGNFDTSHPYGDASASRAARGNTTPVGAFPANHFGLMDMHGNVWEWCSDWYDGGYYLASPLRDPPGPPIGKFRVLRGGSWQNQGSACRAAYRNALAPFQRDSATGFRVVMVMGDKV